MNAIDRLEARVLGLRKHFDTAELARLKDVGPVLSVLTAIVEEIREIQAAIEARADD